MSLPPDTLVFTGRWITVHRLPRLAGMKTDRYEVWSDTHEVIARIRWYGAWRKYAFFPETGTVWEPTCLRQLTLLLEHLTKHQRQSQPRTGAHVP